MPDAIYNVGMAEKETRATRFGWHLRAAREYRRISQDELAARTKAIDPLGMGVCQSDISRYESGERLPGFDNLMLLAEFFGSTWLRKCP
jgi:transcriptional regulator with XRE-family HTH domain